MNGLDQAVGPDGIARLHNDKWLASSLLNKAIRRGSQQWALAAAQALFDVDPQRLWRRLVTIAAEDIGIADLKLLADIVTAHRSRNKGAVERRWEIVEALLNRMCRTTKCRATDDLVMVATYGRYLEHERRIFMTLPLAQVAKVAVTSEDLEIAAVAAVYCLGTMRPGTTGFGARRGSPAMLFDEFLFSGHFVTVTEMCRDGFAATGCVLFGVLPILTRFWNLDTFDTTADDYLPSGLHDGVPSCAVDYFTRPGRAAISRFLKGSSATAQWINQNVASQRRAEALGVLLFSIDSGLCGNRLVWPIGQRLREQADIFSNPGTPDARVALDLFRADFAEFDRERCHDL